VSDMLIRTEGGQLEVSLWHSRLPSTYILYGRFGSADVYLIRTEDGQLELSSWLSRLTCKDSVQNRTRHRESIG
jgi:hypothetical protein